MTDVQSIRAFNRYYATQIGLAGKLELAGLSYPQSRTLFEIGVTEGARARDIASDLGLDEGYVSRLVKGLEKRGLITREAHAEDARVQVLGLSDKGREVHSRMVVTAEEAVRAMIATLPQSSVTQLLEAMSTVRALLSWPDTSAPEIRGLQTGDAGWVVKRHGELYAESQGFDLSFEALVAKIMADFVETRAAPRDAAWVATSDGVRLGCVFIVGESESVARLRLMLVEPFARGRGVGQSLVATAIDHCRAQGFEKIVLWTQKNLEEACRLYARNGFELTESKPDDMFGRSVENQTWELTL